MSIGFKEWALVCEALGSGAPVQDVVLVDLDHQR